MNRSEHELPGPVHTPSLAEKQVIQQVEDQQGDMGVTVNKKNGSTHIVVVLGMNTIIADMRADCAKSKDYPVVRAYGVMPDVLISKVNIQEYLDQWFKGDSLSDVSAHMQGVLAQLSASVKDNETMLDVLSLLREVDQRLTHRINEFCLGDLNLEFSYIDSFIEDYAALRRVILKQNGADYVNALNAFDQNLLATLFDRTSNVYEQDLIDGLADGVNAVGLSSTFSVTLAPFDRAVLKLPTSRDPLTLVSSQHRLIYEAVKDLFENDGDNPFQADVEKHWLVTKDGVRYRIRRHISDKSIYLKMQ